MRSHAFIRRVRAIAKPRVVVLPVYNEAANLGALLDVLLRDASIDRVIAVDDCSSDASPVILREAAAASTRLEHHTSAVRSGQLAAWRAAAEHAPAESILCFIDADSIPSPGSVERLIDCIEKDASIAIASGRVVPDAASHVWPAARFRASALHRLRSRGKAREAVIGRFFATRREWFLTTATRSDVIANDAYLAASAARAGLRSLYESRATCTYAESANTFDFAAQRQRADAGYRQLREMQLLLPEDEPAKLDYALALLPAAAIDPVGAVAWIAEQLRSRRLRAYRPAGNDAGAWDVQASTKRELTRSAHDERA